MSDWKNVQYKDGKMRTSEGGGGGGSSTFAGLDDVNFSNLQNGQVPKYNSTTHKWENSNESGGGGTVTDVQVDGVSVVNQQGVAEIEMPTPPTISVEDVEVNGESVVNAQKVAEIKSYKEVTLAEYTALPDTKLNDGVMYCIKDVGSANQFPPLIYSDEEREVGVWRDGKPLYQKSFAITNIPSSFSDYIECQTIDGMNLAVKIEFTAKRLVSGNATYYIGNGVSRGETAATYLIGFRQRDNKIYYIINQYGSSISDIQVTVQYTKSTDTPGSGTWTTQSEYAHHYDNIEKVIGTFFGKPLYERSWTLPSEVTINPSSWTSLGISNTNIDLIVNAIGTSEWGISRVFSVSSKVDNANLVALCTRGGNDTLKYVILQYTKTTD